MPPQTFHRRFITRVRVITAFLPPKHVKSLEHISQTCCICHAKTYAVFVMLKGMILPPKHAAFVMLKVMNISAKHAKFVSVKVFE